MIIDPNASWLRAPAEEFVVGIHEEALRLDPADIEALEVLAHHYTRQGRIEEGLALDERLVTLLPDDGTVRYNLGCSLALAGRAADALAALEEAVRLGWSDVAHARRDPDLAHLRDAPEFTALLDALERAGDDPGGEGLSASG